MKLQKLFLLVFMVAFFVIGMTVYVVNGQNRRQTSKKLQFIDTHNHLSGFLGSRKGKSREDYKGAADSALVVMNKLGIKTMIIMPTPQTVEQHNKYTLDTLLKTLKKFPDRFAYLGGGGTLNPMIQEAISSGETTDKMKKDFEKEALAILANGAVGFGEMTAEHLSLNPKHPYIKAPPDHPLFLLLADIAARKDVPIDIHMEAIPQKTQLPDRLKPFSNPKQLQPNIEAFERLLDHNKKTKIIWVHLGWDNVGFRTAKNMRKLLDKHSNLYMSIRMSPLKNPKARSQNRLTDSNGKIEDEWLALIKDFSDRFIIGSDEFFLSPKMRNKEHPSTGSTDETISLLSQFPDEIVRKLGFENAQILFNLTK